MGFISILFYMGFLYFGAMIAPGVGVSGRLMVLMPSALVEWAHAPGYGLLAWLFILGLRQRHWPFWSTLVAGSSAAFAFGLLTEACQATVPGRNPSIDDLMTDAVGIGFVALLLSFRKVFDLVSSADPVAES